MYLRKTIIASAVALVLASTSSVMAEKQSYIERLPAEAKPLIEPVATGLFVAAPIVNNMSVMIVRVYNASGELVLNHRSKGEPVELLAANLPDGEYSYQVKTLYQLDIPEGDNVDTEATSRRNGNFTIINQSLFDDELRDMEALPSGMDQSSLLEQMLEKAAVLAGHGLNAVIPAAHAQNLTASSSSPQVFFDDSSDPGTDYVINGDSTFEDFRIRDLIGTNAHTVIDINSDPGVSLNRDSLVIGANGDIHMGGGMFYLDDLSATMSIGWNSTVADFSISDATPDIRFHDETDTAEAEMELNGGFFRLWTRTTTAASFTIPFAAHVDAPTDSLLIDSAGDIRMGANIRFDTDASPTLNIGGTASTGNTLHLEGSSPELVFTGLSTGVEIEGYNGFEIHMDTTGNGNSNTFRVVDIANAAPSDSLVIDASGNMGLGTNLPTESVDVERVDAGARMKFTSITNTGNEAPQIVWRRARNAGGGSPGATQLNDNIGIFSFRGHDGANWTGSRGLINVVASQNWAAGAHGTEMVFQTTANNSAAPVEVMRITNDGKVRINGVELNVPDYVFEDDYELMTLDQLAAYIEENKHLPGVASAHEVNTQGLDLAGSQMSVLEKVEELTLYTLQQHQELKQMATLKAENEQLKAAHRQLLTAFHSQQKQLDKVDQLEQMVNQLMQSQEGKSVYTSLK